MLRVNEAESTSEVTSEVSTNTSEVEAQSEVATNTSEVTTHPSTCIFVYCSEAESTSEVDAATGSSEVAIGSHQA